MKISIGSINPAKIDAVKEAFEEIATKKISNLDFTKISFESCEIKIPELNNTPKTIDEMIYGASKRAMLSLKDLTSDFGVGIEGGIFSNKNGTFLTAYAVISSKKSVVGVGAAPAIKIPSHWKLGNDKSFELGTYVDELTGQKDAKYHRGAIGILTDNIITRQDSLRLAVVCAYYSLLNEEHKNY